MLFFPSRRDLINRSKLVVAQFPAECTSVFQCVEPIGGTGDRNHVFVSPQKPVKGYLTNALSTRLCNRTLSRGMQPCATLDLAEARKKFDLATREKMAHDIILAEIHDAAVEDTLTIFTSGINAESTPYLLEPS